MAESNVCHSSHHKFLEQNSSQLILFDNETVFSLVNNFLSCYNKHLFYAARSIAVEERSLIYEKINKCLLTLQKLLVLDIINFIIEATFFQQALHKHKNAKSFLMKYFP